MARPGEYADVLRAIGRFLELQSASEVEIVDEGPYLRASWQAGDGSRERRTYRAFELDRLRLEARLLRSGSGPGTPQGGLSETLRALGGELDRTQTELLSVLQVGDGFQVSTLVGGRHLARTYSKGEITALILEQRARRRGPGGQNVISA